MDRSVHTGYSVERSSFVMTENLHTSGSVVLGIDVGGSTTKIVGFRLNPDGTDRKSVV